MSLLYVEHIMMVLVSSHNYWLYEAPLTWIYNTTGVWSADESSKILQDFPNMINHETCIEVSSNRPSIGSVIREISLDILSCFWEKNRIIFVEKLMDALKRTENDNTHYFASTESALFRTKM